MMRRLSNCRLAFLVVSFVDFEVLTAEAMLVVDLRDSIHFTDANLWSTANLRTFIQQHSAWTHLGLLHYNFSIEESTLKID